MILDILSNWKKYEWKSPLFAQAFEFLATLKPDAPDGRTDLAGDDLYCSLQRFDTTPEEGHEFEAHREYTDIQYVISGDEQMLWAPQSSLTVTKPYRPDVEMYALAPGSTSLIVRPGQFTVFFPQDAHGPCIAVKDPMKVLKAVVKVRWTPTA